MSDVFNLSKLLIDDSFPTIEQNFQLLLAKFLVVRPSVLASSPDRPKVVFFATESPDVLYFFSDYIFSSDKLDVYFNKQRFGTLQDFRTAFEVGYFSKVLEDSEDEDIKDDVFDYY